MAKLTPAITGNNPPEHQDYYNPDPVALNQLNQSTINRPTSGNTNPNQINWLGSSYSGVDIKMVAHLYTTPQADTQLVDLQNQVAQYNETVSILDAASSSILQVLDPSVFYGTSSEINILSLGATSANTVAGGILLSTFWSVQRGNWFDGSRQSAISLAFKSKADTYRIVADNAQNKLSNLEQVRQKSTDTVTLGTLQTLSVQTYREKVPIRALGNSYVKGYGRGNRTIGGSMIFTLFNEHSLAQLIRSMSATGSIYGEMNNDLSAYIADQLPPFDVTIVFANEYGSLSQMGIYGIEFVSDGMTLSIEDLLSEQVLQFVARDVDIMTSKGNIRLSRAQRGMHFNDQGQEVRASDLPFTSKEAYAKYLERLGMRRKRNSW